MNKDLINQLPADEQPVAEKISSAAETMKLSQGFQWNLETQLMDAYKSKQEGVQRSPFMKFLAPAGWALAAVCGVLLLSWIFRSLLPTLQPAAAPTATQEVSFEDRVRTGNICSGPLAVAHGFAVFLTNADKTGFVTLDEQKAIGELRSFNWSPDGQWLAIVGNTMGSGNIHVTNPSGRPIEDLLSVGELGYTMDAAWSRDGKQFVVWSSQNNRTLYLLNTDGSGLTEKQLNVQILGAPQFWPDGSSVVFYGTTPTSTGLFEVMLVNFEIAQINSSVEGASSYAFSPDGSRLAYMEYDREIGEARLVSEDITARERAILGILPIPKGSGSSVPNIANMSWSVDGKSIVFDVGRGANDRVIYHAHADGTELIKVVEAGYAPAISPDGKCLAYMNNKQVFLLDLGNLSINSTTTTPLLLADLPEGRAIPNYQQDKLQWKPGKNP
ncbi:MAG: hypothetical protein ABI621_05200 [Chloroflexota bacterium]